jgi:uncharacterized protein with gpF-like domain
MSIFIPKKVKKSRKKQRVGRGVKAPRSVKSDYYAALKSLIDELKSKSDDLYELISSGASLSEIARKIDEDFAKSINFFDSRAYPLAKWFINASNQVNKRRIENMVKSAFSLDYAQILDSENIKGQMDLALIQNVGLIKSIPGKYYEDVLVAVKNNYQGLLTEDMGLKERLKKLGSITDSRAQLIARDQTSKVSSTLTRIRHENIGILEYIWSNSRDTHVVGNPAGLYPKGNRLHGNHWEREGKRYSYSNPPSDGNPGEPIQCRCVALPVIDLNKLNAVYV